MKIYRIEEGILKPANKQYNQLGHQYEIILINKSIVTSCGEDQSIPRVQCDFSPISDIILKKQNDIVGKCN